MQAETLSDVLDWTRSVHANLADCLDRGSVKAHRERVTMLLDYLSEHEQRLKEVLEASKRDASDKALNTWCYDYFENAPFDPEEVCDADFGELDVAEIDRRVIDLHETVIDLYRYLLGRAESPSTRELVEGLLELEKNETMLMARDMRQMEDL